MQIFWYIVAGIVGGLLGGMGMGGGTLLIPIVTIFLDVGQKEAQAINLIAFIPMAIVALIIHAKNKLIDKKRLIWQIVPAAATAIPAALLAVNCSSGSLKKWFGIFLIVLGSVSLVIYIIKYIKENRKKRIMWTIPKFDKNRQEKTDKD